MDNSARGIRQRSIDEQLMRLEYHGFHINDHRRKLNILEQQILDDLDNINKAKRRLYELGWRE
jgi:hypothetical protein